MPDATGPVYKQRLGSPFRSVPLLDRPPDLLDVMYRRHVDPNCNSESTTTPGDLVADVLRLSSRGARPRFSGYISAQASLRAVVVGTSIDDRAPIRLCLVVVGNAVVLGLCVVKFICTVQAVID